MTSVWPACILFILIGIAGSESIVDQLVYVGCFDLEYSIDHNLHQYVKNASLEKCSSYCCRLKTLFAGIEQNDDFCYCGNKIPEFSRKQSESLCNTTCSDSEWKKCGGESLMSLFDIMEVSECSANVTHKIQAPGTKFLIGTQSDVRQHSINDVNHYDVIRSTNERVVAVDYHIARKLVFYYSNNTLYKTSMEPIVPSVIKATTPIANTSHCDGIAVDWVSDKVFFCDNGSIVYMDLGGGEPTVLYRRQGKGLISRMEVDPFKGILFWTVRGTIESYQFLDPKNFRSNVSDEGIFVRTLALDTTAQRVFFIGDVDDASALFSVNYQGGDHREHMRIPQLNSAYGMGIVAGHVFWLSYVNAMDELYGAPLPLNGTDSVQRLTTMDKAVWHMKVIHPDLQKEPVTDSARTKPVLH